MFNDAKQPRSLRLYLKRTVIPSFSEPVPGDLLALHMLVSSHHRELNTLGLQSNDHSAFEQYDRQDDFCEAAKKVGFQNPDLLQFRLRRHSEGGDDLVSMWVKIFTDFHDSLSH